MPGLPAIDFRSIRPHAGAQDRGFEELCFQLLPALGPLPPGAAGPQRHGAPDGGVEFIVTLPDGGVWAWQAKYLFALGPKEFKQLDASVKRALDSQSTLRRYTFCLPYNRPAGDEADAKSALKKWKDHCEKWQKWARERGREPVEFAYVGESELLALLARAGHAGRAHYWFNATVLTPQWFQARLDEAIAHAGSRYTPVLNVELPISFVFEGLGRTRAFRDRLRGLLRDLRDASGRWHQLRKTAVDDARLKDLVDEAVRQLDAVDARAIAMDTSGTAPLDFPGLATACSTADQALEKIQECLDTRRREANQNRESSDEGGARPALRSHDPDESGYFAAVTPVWRTGSALRAFAEFVEGDAARLINLPALLLTGEPGIGKTHLLCDVAERRCRAGQPTLVLFGQHFGPGDPWPQLLQHLELDCTPDVFLGALNTAAEAADARALLFIDALNESAAPRPWPDHLAGVVAKVSGYPRLGIALGCRTSFVPAVIPDGMLPEKLVRVHHPGFSERTSEAVRRFFEEFKLARPDFPLVVPEFRNPLFLKLMCQALRERGEARFPRGATAVTALFALFLEGVERRLSAPDRCDYAAGLRRVQASVDALAREMLERETEWLPFDVAHDLTNALLPRTEWSRSLLFGLLTEGVLIRHRWRGDADGSGQEVVAFAYQRLGDHARAAVLCADASGIEGVRARLKIWSGDLGSLYQHSNLLEALSIHVPERFDGCEAHELVEDPLAPPVRDAYLHSLIWRKPTAFRADLSLPYLNRITRASSFTHNPVLDTLLEVACVPEHPLNAEFLHRNLVTRTLAERDAGWTAHVKYGHDPDTPIGRLVEWAWHEDTAPCADDAALLAGIVLSWCLTSSTRGVRDPATKALVSLLRSRASVLVDLLTRFHGVNDPYVTERLYAVAYGCVMLNRDPVDVGQVAALVYKQVFAAGQPPVHILLRDYARGTVERAWQLGAVLSDVNPEKVRPPYQSSWPLRAPMPEAIEASKAAGDDPYRTIRSSVLEWDFHRYVIQPAVSRFIAPNQSAKRRAERKRREKAAETAAAVFEQSLTDRQRQVLRRLTASNPATVEDFLKKLSEKQRKNLLEAQRWTSEPRDRSRPVPFDAHVASRWLFRRVLDMGWTPEQFGELDRLLQQDRWHLGHGTERIGKKYQWIGFHELLAHLADRCQIDERWGDGRPQSYEGPWQLGARDIDPSLLLAATPVAAQETAALSWWAPVAAEVPDAADKDAREGWLSTLDGLPHAPSLVDVRDPKARRWLVLVGNYDWSEPVPPELDPHRVDRCTVWYSLESYVVRRADALRFLSWARDRHWFDGWMPERHRLGDACLGEYPWHPAAADARGGWDTPGDGGMHSPVPLLATAATYTAGHGADASLDRPVRGLVPSSALLEGMSAAWRGVDFEYVDTRGGVVAWDPSAGQRGPSCLLVDSESFKAYLDRHEYAVVWTILGRKLIIGPSLHRIGIHGRIEFSGVLALTQGAVEQVSLHHEYVPPGGSR